MICACLLLQERSVDENAFYALAEACGRFTPKIAVRPHEAIFLDLSGLEHAVTEALELKLISLARRFGWMSRVAIADEPGRALAEARHGLRAARGARARLRELPLESLIDFKSPFHFNHDLERKLVELTQTLKLLGLKNVGEFAEVPPHTLASRFGKEAVELAQLLQGVSPHPACAWPGFHPSPKISEKCDVEADRLETLLFVLRGLADRAMARLRGRGERASVIEIEFDLVKWSTLKSFKRQWRIELALAQGSVAGLLPILQEHLGFSLDREPLEAPVQAVRFEVLETVPGHGAQRDFFSKREEESEAWDALLGRLSHRLGERSVFFAQPVDRYLPEGAYERRIERKGKPMGTDPDFPDRPARVLKAPEPLQRLGSSLFHSSSGKRWHVAEWDGPERLSSEWWRDSKFEGFSRDYYRVVAASGEQLWVFLDRKNLSSRIYLHGFFD